MKIWLDQTIHTTATELVFICLGHVALGLIIGLAVS
jgi:hypothetical protein